jgi:hypothetical protein
MPQIPAKFADREKVIIKERELFGMEVEAEVDRQNLCHKIVDMVDQTIRQEAIN